ncbi:MAG: NUDIX hydrolase [Anaerolineae bacterium]|nr:NUDIX hydrolase [Anaerolineae bacterium]
MLREYPAAPIPSVGAIVLKGDQVLLVLRGQQPSRGKWSIPGGVLELGEVIEQAARREVREECGLEIEVGPVVEVRDAIFRDEDEQVRFHYVLIDVLARYVEGTPTAGSDVEDARWVGESELSSLALTPGLRDVLLRAIRSRDLDFRGLPA